MRVRFEGAALLTLLLAACVGGTPPTDPPSTPTFGVSSGSPFPTEAPLDGVAVDIEESEYTIEGDTPADLAAAMAARGLRDYTGHEVTGLTTWYISWDYRYGGIGECRIESPTVRADINFVFPAWQGSATATADTRAAWQRYVAALRVHESGHAAFAVAGVNDVMESLRAQPPQQTCDRLEAAADAEGERIVDRIRAEDLRYDRETDHGATQGVVLPP